MEPPFERRPERRPVPAGSRRPRPALRRVKRVVRHVDPFSVFKGSLLFYTALLLVWLAIVAIAYKILESMDLFEKIKELQAVFVLNPVEITLGSVEKWAFLIGLTFTILASLANLFFAFLYNVIADAVGGIELTFVERDV